MSVIDLTKKFVSLTSPDSSKHKDNMTLYVNSRMNLTKFEYLDVLYDINDYTMKEDYFLISCIKNQYKIPVDLILYNESLAESLAESLTESLAESLTESLAESLEEDEDEFRQTDFDQDHSISIDMNSEN